MEKGKPLFSYWQPMEWNYPLKTAGEMISGSRLRSSEGLLTADYWKAGYDECGGGCLDDIWTTDVRFYDLIDMDWLSKLIEKRDCVRSTVTKLAKMVENME
ncbi:hypothetical protein NPIL_695151 [Nephila pilipes]|uniref:Uncharacterized protein n=1 Tax=Nephila pilipes TaxID=299642 RepID=A0A8X6NC16_NEPPI|nr:hypothetical protein NPIL_695151 [Nephila pilipes]